MKGAEAVKILAAIIIILVVALILIATALSGEGIIETLYGGIENLMP